MHKYPLLPLTSAVEHELLQGSDHSDWVGRFQRGSTPVVLGWSAHVESSAVFDAVEAIHRYQNVFTKFGIAHDLAEELSSAVGAHVRELLTSEIRNHIAWTEVVENAKMGSMMPWEPTALWTSSELREAKSLADEADIDELRRQRKLFAVVKEGAESELLYPAFQALPGVTGDVIEQVLNGFGGDSVAALGFFTSANRDLAGLSPVEMLTGGYPHHGNNHPMAGYVIGLEEQERLNAVLRAAKHFLPGN